MVTTPRIVSPWQEDYKTIVSSSRAKNWIFENWILCTNKASLRLKMDMLAWRHLPVPKRFDPPLDWAALGFGS
jgi:hypothetical protein